MRVFFITSAFFPRRSANTNCALAVALQLRDMGMDITFISVAEKQKRTSSINGIKVITVVPRGIDFLSKIDKIAFLRNSMISNWLGIAYRIYRVICAVLGKHSVDRSRVRALSHILINNVKENDVLIPVCFPVEASVAAVKLKSSVNCKIFPYLFDLYAASDTAHKFPILKRMKLRSNLNLENSLFRNSEYLFCSSSWYEWIATKHSSFIERAIFLEHPLINELKVNVGSPKQRIILSGMLSDRVRNPIVGLTVVSKALEKCQDISLDICHSGNCENIVKRFESRHISNYGEVPNEVAQEKMLKAKFFLIIGNNDIRQVQSKVYEFMSMGKPIIYFYKDKLDPIFSELCRYGNVCFLDESLEIDSLTDELIKFISQDYRVIPYKKVSCLFKTYTSEFVAGRIFEHICQDDKPV